MYNTSITERYALPGVKGLNCYCHQNTVFWRAEYQGSPHTNPWTCSPTQATVDFLFLGRWEEELADLKCYRKMYPCFLAASLGSERLLRPCSRIPSPSTFSSSPPLWNLKIYACNLFCFPRNSSHPSLDTGWALWRLKGCSGAYSEVGLAARTRAVRQESPKIAPRVLTHSSLQGCVW